MIPLLNDPQFNYVSPADRAFVQAFDDALTRLGYGCGGAIGEGYCWGRHMLIYRKLGVKSQNVYARIYLREGDIVLRLFLNGIDKHAAFIEHAPAHITEVFTGPFGDCQHCHNQKADGSCLFRKSYTLGGRLIEKCNGNTFWFFQPTLACLPDYLALFTAFYPPRRRKPAKAAAPLSD
ncbi:MAG: hypothetical protein HPY85_16555 [Anaerolineae bacterium]|nr:hypothetical protein [Anaerolineae bacterium]